MIVALDPGGSTGVAVANYGPDPNDVSHDPDKRWMFAATTFGPEPHHQQLWDFLNTEHSRYDELIVVCESFEYRNKERPGLVLDSVEYIGVVKLFVEITKTPMVSFNAATAKRFVQDKNLKRLGLYQKGDAHKHERDAYRHLLYFMTNRLHNNELLRQGWKGDD